MRLGGRESGNVEDRRGGGLGRGGLIAGGGIGTVVLALSGAPDGPDATMVGG